MRKRSVIMLACLIGLASWGWAQNTQADEDLRKIYLYTMVIFMQEMEERYQEDANPPQAWTMLDALHQQKIGYSDQKADYQPLDQAFFASIQAHFTPDQQSVLQERHLFDPNTRPGQVLYYELIYKEHPIGGYHFLPTIADLPTRLAYAFGSKEMGTFMIDQEEVWGEYLSLWMLLVRSHNREFQALMDRHIRAYNQELQRLSKERGR